MATKKKMLQAAAGNATGGVPLDITDVFSTYLYKGQASNKNIENGINLGQSNSGGSVDFSAGAAASGYADTLNVNVPSSSDFGYGTGDYTIEFFVYKFTDKNYNTYFDQRTASQNATTASPFIYSDSGGTLYFYLTGANRITGSGTNVATKAWTHVALCRASSQTRLFVNGTQIGSTYSDSANYEVPASNWSFGGSIEQATHNVEGHMSNVRVVKGSALYTSNFTTPTSALTAVSGTVLLALQGDDPFTDNSSSSHSLTNYGVRDLPRATTFGPFDAADAGKGGLVWIKSRSNTYDNWLYDTVRGNTVRLISNTTAAQGSTGANGITSFNSDGFGLGAPFAEINGSGSTFTSWTFRKAPKFFDVQTWSGDGTSNRAIPHDLDGAVGSYFVKCTSHGTNSDWIVWHKDNWSGANSFHQVLNSTASVQNANLFSATAPDDSNVYLGTASLDYTNATGRTYVGYFFAHNDGDGEFGPDSDQDIIKCGIYNGNGASQEINIGFEPQWLLIKRKDSGEDWIIYDSMRNWRTSRGGTGDSNALQPNVADADTAYTRIHPSATGFGFDSEAGSWSNASGGQYIYIAIRRGPLAPPTAGTEVYKTVVPTANRSDSPEPYWNSGFTVDMAIHRANAGSTGDTFILSRLTGENKGIDTNTAVDENGLSFKAAMLLDYNTGVHSTTGYGASAGSEDMLHMWKRAPGFFDAVAYIGNSTSGRTVSHNLGVVPEMMWVKNRSASSHWQVYHKGLNGGTNPANYWLKLNDVDAEAALSNKWNNTEPTQSVFSVGDSSTCNASGNNYIAYLFASLDGVSKVGSFTSTSGGFNVDCGFSNSARFVLIKRTDTNNDWWLWNSARGIVAGNDPYLYLNNTGAETANADYIDPYSSGFAMTSDWFTSGNFIFYAVA